MLGLDFGRTWSIRLTFGLVYLRLRRAGASEFPAEVQTDSASVARAHFALRFELPHSREAQQALSELFQLQHGSSLFSDFGVPFATPSEGQLAAFLSLLVDELDAGRVELGLQIFGGSFRERPQLDIDLPDLGPPPRAPAPDESFIAVRLLDQKGEPLSGRPFRIELPDGSVREGFTNPDGFARARGFTRDGVARITFSGFDEADFKTTNPSERIIIPVGELPDADPEATNPVVVAAAARAVPASSQEPGNFTLIVLDDVGGPIAGVDVSFLLSDGVQTVATDGAGTAQLSNVRGPVDATLDVAQVRDVLKPRFKAARQPQPFDDSSVIVQPLTERFEPVRLAASKPVSLLLTPTIQCHEIPGANFEFGRSFVRATAIEQLADIAQVLRDTTDMRAMIFGHTDLSGGEALNKELSERRAKAVHALLTHDSQAWEELFSGSADGANWHEKWDLEETQNMLNALSVTDDGGAPLVENGKRDKPTKQAIRRFQRADFPDCPAEQRPLPESDFLGVDGRRTLFLAYAKRISRQPIAPDRFATVGDTPFMGCGEFNPLSLSARDEASRRVNVFLFDPVAEPEDLPCRLRKLPPCRKNLDPAPKELPADGKPPFRCRIFQPIAEKCTSQPSPDLNHDIVLRFPLALSAAGRLLHKYTLEADDATLTIERSLADDSRAADGPFIELSFEHLPENHRYRLTCDDGEQPPYTVFDFSTIKELQDHFRADLMALELNLPSDFLQHVTQPPLATADDDGTPDGADADFEEQQGTA